jgi:hypothetical protein
MSAPDRLKELLNQSKVTGIDFVYVHEDQMRLDVFFLRTPSTLDMPLVGDVTQEQILIYNPSGGTLLSPVPVSGLAWVVVDGRNVLRLTTAVPGDFTLYKLRIDDSRIDPYFNDITFSFKAHCPSDLDCEPPAHECPSEESIDFPVDYRARDFWSFRRALLDFASQRYPDWQDRLEADAGMMPLEVMSALGDELAYYQDRVAREAYLETATQRRSLRRHARLVDYTIHDGLGASTWLNITVKAGQKGKLPAGADIWAMADNGMRVDYEVGCGLAEVTANKKYVVDVKRNTFEPHIWDEDNTCLSVGTTELYIKGHHEDDLPLDDLSTDKKPGKWVLLKTSPKDASIPERAFMVRLIKVNDNKKQLKDPVFKKNITHLVWEKAQALPYEMDMTVLEVHGNQVPVTAGKTEMKRFVIGVEPDKLEDIPEKEKKNIVRAVEREGPNGSAAYLSSLPDSDSGQLVWLGDDPRNARPEIQLEEVKFDAKKGEWVKVREWHWKRSFLGSPSSLPYDRDFTLEDGMWNRVVGYQRIGQEIKHIDYASGDGATIRFGDGEFGSVPAGETVFRVTYRLGNGRRSNLPAGSLKKLEGKYGFIQAVTNPLSAKDGMDPETFSEIRQLAPEAFRAIAFRAVRPEDYAGAAERLAWVQRAGATFRWTGSWLSAFVTPDPKGAVSVSESQRSELVNQLDRYRQAGREAYALEPRYANLDLEITVCVKPDAYCGEVKERVLEALLGKSGVRARSGFFSPDNFTFGTSLDRSSLEAVIQNVSGVRAVKGMRIHRRGWYTWKKFTELSEPVAKNEIIRIENDPLYPERGSLRLIMEGGA